MDSERLRKIAGDGRFIHGIHNYCDRWCERCHFTARCLNYAIAEEQFPDRESRDVTNEKFWKNLEATFRMTLAILLHLSRLRAATEQEFPTARLFVRPGFDQEVE